MLGDTNRDVLLKAVIQKADYASKRLEDVNDRLTAETKHNFREQEKTNKYLMEITEELQTSITQTRNQSDRKVKHINETLKLHQNDLMLI